MSPSKLEGGHKMTDDLDNHEIDLDDEDDEQEIGHDDRTETISVPILIGQKPRNIIESAVQQQSDSSTEQHPTIRTTIMYGRPLGPLPLHYQMMAREAQSLAPQPEIEPPSPAPLLQNPLATILQAIIASRLAQQQAEYRRIETTPSESQPQRLILLITHRGSTNEASTPREEPELM